MVSKTQRKMSLGWQKETSLLVRDAKNRMDLLDRRISNLSLDKAKLERIAKLGEELTPDIKSTFGEDGNGL